MNAKLDKWLLALWAVFKAPQRKLLYTDSVFRDKLPATLKGPIKSTYLDGVRRILDHAAKLDLTKHQVAYVLATVYHETAYWMCPIREGAWRYGPNYTDANAVAAVTNAVAKGLIRKNYALRDTRTGKSYYGRGLVQITWYDEYLQMGQLLGIDLVNDPDLALHWPTSLDILFTGMIKGTFRNGHKLSDIQSADDWYAARGIINGDTKKNGNKIAAIAAAYYVALT